MHSVSGETTRKGFYVYDEKIEASPDPELEKYIDKSRSISGVTIDPKVSLSLSLISELCSEE
jgi:enoyl-CoA hydratase/3-hydroxyacyl-CoA dehydrogenase